MTNEISIKKLVSLIFNPTYHLICVTLVVLAVGKVLVQKRCGKKLGFSVWSILCQKLVCMVMYHTYYHHNQPVVSARNTKNCIHRKNPSVWKKLLIVYSKQGLFWSGLSSLSFCSHQNTRCDVLGLPVLIMVLVSSTKLCF